MYKKIAAIFFSLVFMIVSSIAMAQNIKEENQNPQSCQEQAMDYVEKFGEEVRGTGQMMIDDGNLMRQKGQQYNDEELTNRGNDLQQKGDQIKKGGNDILNMIDSFTKPQSMFNI